MEETLLSTLKMCVARSPAAKANLYTPSHSYKNLNTHITLSILNKYLQGLLISPMDALHICLVVR
jgi:hypothetical protein